MCSWFVHLHPVIIWPIRHAGLAAHKDGDRAARKQSLPSTSLAQTRANSPPHARAPSGRRRPLFGLNDRHDGVARPAALDKLASADSVRRFLANPSPSLPRRSGGPRGSGRGSGGPALPSPTWRRGAARRQDPSPPKAPPAKRATERPRLGPDLWAPGGRGLQVRTGPQAAEPPLPCSAIGALPGRWSLSRRWRRRCVGGIVLWAGPV